MTILWTVNYMSYEMAKELKRGDHEDVAPLGVYSSRDKAVAYVLKQINEEIVEDNGFADESDVKDLYALDDMKWIDCHAFNNRKRWRFFNQYDEGSWIIAEHELDES